MESQSLFRKLLLIDSQASQPASSTFCSVEVSTPRSLPYMIPPHILNREKAWKVTWPTFCKLYLAITKPVCDKLCHMAMGTILLQCAGCTFLKFSLQMVIQDRLVRLRIYQFISGQNDKFIKNTIPQPAPHYDTCRVLYGVNTITTPYFLEVAVSHFKHRSICPQHLLSLLQGPISIFCDKIKVFLLLLSHNEGLLMF